MKKASPLPRLGAQPAALRTFARSWNSPDARLILSLFVLLLLPVAAKAANVTWSNAPTTNTWDTAGDWAGGTKPVTNDALFFDASSTYSLSNNFAVDTRFNGLTFNSGAGAYVLAGNSITLGGNIVNNSTTLQTIAFDITSASSLGRNYTMTAGGGNILISGRITSGAINTAGTGTLILTGNNSANAFNMALNTGTTLRISASNNLTTGTFNINNATLDMRNDVGFNIGKNITLNTASPTYVFNVDRAVGGTGTNQTMTIGNLTLSQALGNGGIMNMTVTGSNGYGLTTGTLTATNYLNAQTWNIANNAPGLLTMAGFASDHTTSGNDHSLVFSGTGNITIGAVTDTGSGVGKITLIKNGANTLTLTSSNTYGKRTTLNQGTVALSNSAAFGTGDVAVASNSTILALGNLTVTNNYTLASGATATFDSGANLWTNSGVISSNGALSKAGSGTLILSQTNTYTGTTTINSGTLQLGNGGSTGSLATTSAITNNGTFAINRSNAVSQGTDFSSAAITGTGSFTQAGTGTTTLTAANTYTGGTTVNGGTLALSGGANRLNTAGSVSVSSGATLNLGGNNQTLAGLTGSGNVTNSTGTLTLSNTSGNNNFAGSIAGAGSLTKSGAGAVTLTGANSYSGATTINEGLLTVNGTSTGSAISINNGGTLGGSGSVGAVTVASGGTIAPGNSPGTLTVASSIWNAGGNYNWQLYNATGTAGSSWDVVTVNGLLDLSALALGNKFNINLWTLSATNSDVNGSAINFNTTNSYSWNIANYETITNFNASYFNINTKAINGTSGFANAIDPNGSFSLSTSNNSLWLNYVAAAPSNSVLNLLSTSFASGTNAIITGGTNAFTVSVTNGPGANAALTFTGTNGSNVSGTIASTTVAAGASANAAGLAYTGTNVGTNEGSFTLTAPVASNSPVTGSVTNVVYDHASGSLASNVISVGNTHVGYSNALTGSVTASNASGFRVNLAADSLLSNGTTLSGISGVAAGGVTNVTATVSTGLSAGAISNNYTYTFKDNSTLSGASGNVGTTNISVTGGVYAYAAGAVGSTNINLGNIHAGGSFGTNNLVVSNTASGPAGYVENLAASFTNGSGVATSGSVNALAAGSNSSALSVTLTNNTAGAQSGTVGVAFTSEALSGSGLSNTSQNTTNISVTGFVYTGQGVWNTNGGSWATFANWQQAGGTPGIDGALSANDTATFGTGGSGSVTLDGISPSLQSVTFSNSAASYTIASGSGSATLTLKAGDTTASINNQAGSHVISAALNLANDVTLNSATNTALNISGAIGGTSGLIKTGSGTATLSAANTFSGDTLVSAGTLIISGGTTNSDTTVKNSGTLGGIGSLGAVTVQSGGTLAPSIGGTTGQMSVDSLALESGSTVNMILNSTNAGAYDSIFSKSTTETIAFGGRLNVTLKGTDYNDSNKIGLFQLFSTGAGITGGGVDNNFSQVFVTYGGYSGNLDYYRDVNRWQVWDKTSDSYIGLSMADGNFLVVPEPSTYALIGLGVLLMVVAYRRRA